MEKKNNNQNFWIYGRHAVIAAIQSNRRDVFSLLLTKEAQQDIEGSNIEIKKSIKITIVESKHISSHANGYCHQGYAAFVSNLYFSDFKRILQNHKNHSMIVALDMITDPHNVGAIIRSAAAFGACAVISTKDNSILDGNIICNTSSGAIENIDVARVTNLSESLKVLKDAGYWIVGMEASEDCMDIKEISKYNKVVIVMGSEGSGMRRLVKDRCDILVKIPISNAVESLNVSNASAIAMFCWNYLGR